MTTKEQLTEKVERGISLFRQHRTAINHFVELVERHAEDKMLITGKLAGRALRCHEGIAESHQ